MRLSKANLRDTFRLTVIELTKQCFLDLIDILNVHIIFLFLDLNQLQKCISTSCLSILLHISLQYLLNILLTKLSWIDLAWYRIDICKLSLDNLCLENRWELNDDTV